MKRFALLLAIVLPFMAASLTSCEKATPTTGTLTVHISNLKYDIEVEVFPYGFSDYSAHLQSSVFKLSKDLIDSIHEEGIVAYTS